MSNAPERKYWIFALKIAGDFGATIAVPVVVLAVLGRYLDARWGTSPWLLVVGFAFAALVSGVMINKKAKKYGKEYQAL